jgi:hypothetical protein
VLESLIALTAHSGKTEMRPRKVRYQAALRPDYRLICLF